MAIGGPKCFSLKFIWVLGGAQEFWRGPGPLDPPLVTPMHLYYTNTKEAPVNEMIINPINTPKTLDGNTILILELDPTGTPIIGYLQLLILKLDPTMSVIDYFR